MKGSTLVILFLVAVAAVVAVLLLRDSGSNANDSVQQSIEQELEIAAASKVEIIAADSKVTINQQDGGWQVGERGGFLADTSKLATLLKELADLSATQTIEVAEEQLARLELNDPVAGVAGSGTKILISDSEGQKLSEWIAGSQYFPDSPTPGARSGRYYRQPGKPVILSMAMLRDLSAQPADWLLKDILLPDLQVSAIEVDFADEQQQGWSISTLDPLPHGDKDTATEEGQEATTKEPSQPEFQFDGLAEDESIGDTAISELIRRLEGLRFEDVRIDDAEFKAAVTAEIVSSDGAVLRLQFAPEKDGMTPLKIISPVTADEADPTDEELEGQRDNVTYLVNTWALGQLTQPRSEWVEKASEEEQQDSEQQQ